MSDRLLAFFKKLVYKHKPSVFSLNSSRFYEKIDVSFTPSALGINGL